MSSTAHPATQYELKPLDLRESIAGLVSQTRVALFAALDEEFLRDEHVAALEVTTAQFTVMAYVFKKNVNSACVLCEQLDYDSKARG